MSTRVATSQLFQNGQTSIGSAREREVRSSERASSQKQLTRPSDDPGAWMKVADLKNDLALQDSLAKNAAGVNHVLTATENLLSDLQGFANRAHEIAVASSSTTGAGEQSRKAYATEAEALYDSVIRTLNTRYAGRTLLAGFKSEGPAFNHDGEFVGDSNSISLEIDRDFKVPTNLSTDETVFGKGQREGVNIPKSFKDLLDGLKNDDVNQVRSTLDSLLKAIDQLSLARTHIGARMKAVEDTTNSHAEQKIQKEEAISQVEEADPIKAFSDLARDQTVLKAAISTTDKILHDNSLDMLYK
jgi:flagellar hook-associated protein 3 FlgL